MLRKPIDADSCFSGICGRQQIQVGKSSQAGNILHAVMGIAEISVGHPSTDRDHSDGQIMITHIVSDLFQTAQCREIANRIRKDLKTLRCQACRNARHVLFGDTGIQKSFREFSDKGLDDRISQVTHNQKNSRIPAGANDQLLDERRSQRSASS